MNNDLNKIVFIIPSLDPDDKMPSYVNDLINNGAKHIIVVNDGSHDETLHYFDELKNKEEVIILNHEVNKGKGAALKNAFSYVLTNMKDVKGIVTADADGQHSTLDTIKVARKMLETNEVVFGTRNFNEENVPFKSRNGNKITSFIFKLLFGRWVNDTQTGLRAIPYDYLDTCLQLKGERYEYEIKMLIKIVEDKKPIIEEPIDTIYYDSNRGSHFNPLKDSFKIYEVMFSKLIGYAQSGFVSYLFEIIIYSILINTIFDNSLQATACILASTLISRFFSSVVNYLINKNKVFKSKEGSVQTMIKYAILVFVQAILSSFLVSAMFKLTNFDTTVIKIFIDFILSLISFKVQNTWVF